ncbi:MAG: RcnB family protein [Azonexus sp.]|nr:RcnB family protein [Azonexus sp.]MDZ4315146.1 RcnB family protein [Azonexus sp.]
MNKKTILAAIMTLAMAFGSTAFADNDKHRGDRGRQAQSHEQNRGWQGRQHDQRVRHDNRSARYDNDRRGRGAGRNHDVYRGQRISSEYRNHNYVVDDWRGHRLSAPPRGQHWVQMGPDYVLVAIASGIIAQIILSH